jgi:hypothetical protein
MTGANHQRIPSIHQGKLAMLPTIEGAHKTTIRIVESMTTFEILHAVC